MIAQHDEPEAKARADDRARREARDAWWAWYRRYLDSPAWKDKRRRVLDRDKVCQACLRRPATEVHHRSYASVGNEPLFDLAGVCSVCHRAVHNPAALAEGLRRNFEKAGVLA